MDPTKCVHQLLVEVIPRKKVDSRPTTCERVLLLFSNLNRCKSDSSRSVKRRSRWNVFARLDIQKLRVLQSKGARRREAHLLEHCLVRLVESKPSNVHHILVHACHSSATRLLLPTCRGPRAYSRRALRARSSTHTALFSRHRMDNLRPACHVHLWPVERFERVFNVCLARCAHACMRDAGGRSGGSCKPGGRRGRERSQAGTQGRGAQPVSAQPAACGGNGKARRLTGNHRIVEIKVEQADLRVAVWCLFEPEWHRRCHGRPGLLAAAAGLSQQRRLGVTDSGHASSHGPVSRCHNWSQLCRRGTMAGGRDAVCLHAVFGAAARKLMRL